MSHIRYWASTMLLALAGGFMIVESQAFSAGSAAAIAFAVAIVLTALALIAIYAGRTRERLFSLLPACAALIGGWTIVAMNVFSASTEKWLAFAGGAGVLALALCALTLHELTVERVVHSLELGVGAAEAETATPPRVPAARNAPRPTATARRPESAIGGA